VIELFAAFLLMSSQVAQDGPESTTDCTLIKPLFPGQESDCDGLFVPEGRYTLFLKAELKVDELDGRLKIKNLYIEQLEALYREATKVKKIPWYRRLSFNRVLFFALGTAITALAVYGGTKLVQAAAK